jgi:hypothetical protein
MTKTQFVAELARVERDERDERVDHPPHYHKDTIEAIDVIEAWKLNFNKGNVLKYISRAGLKDPARELEDLNKALWYLRREIERLTP